MQLDAVSMPIAFAAGLIFFFSPCVWPLYPAYISYMVGASVNDIKTNLAKSRVFKNALGFVIGFTIVFVLLGATATTVGGFLATYQDLFQIIAGILIILFGIQLGGFFKLPFLNQEMRIDFIPEKPGFFSSAIFGTTFAFAWTPCATAVLGVILIYASQTATVYQGMSLLAVFSLGFSIPFLLLAIFMKQLHPRLSKVMKHLPLLNTVGGFVLVVIGLLVAFDKFTDISLWLFNLMN